MTKMTLRLILAALMLASMVLGATRTASGTPTVNVTTLRTASAAALLLAPDPGGKVICPGQKATQIHKWYTAKWGVRVPLRCGTWSVKGYGVRKLVGKNRWNVWFKAMIMITLRNPYRIEDQGTTKVYRTRTFWECIPSYHFRVVVQTAKIGGTKRMRGIITAYQKFE